jgi:transcriptional regulator with PAS, ATPase and Fis domain
MTKEEIHSSLNKMLENSKSKNFISHLVRAYFPIKNIEKVFERPKGVFKCVITGANLMSINEVLAGLQTEEIKSSLLDSLKVVFDENNQVKLANNPYLKIVGDKKLALTGKDTTTFLSYEGLSEFHDWAITKALTGDKHINWLFGNIRHKSLINIAENIENPLVKKKVDIIKKKSGFTKLTYSLNDASDVLGKLKLELEKNEK